MNLEALTGFTTLYFLTDLQGNQSEKSENSEPPDFSKTQYKQ
jgi:hypothetical protein